MKNNDKDELSEIEILLFPFEKEVIKEVIKEIPAKKENEIIKEKEEKKSYIDKKLDSFYNFLSLIQMDIDIILMLTLYTQKIDYLSPLVLEAALHLSNNDYKRAELSLDSFFKYASYAYLPNLYTASYLRGKLYAKLERFDEAIKSYEESIALRCPNPMKNNIIINQLAILLEQGKLKEAKSLKKQYDKILKEDPFNKDEYLKLIKNPNNAKKLQSPLSTTVKKIFDGMKSLGTLYWISLTIASGGVYLLGKYVSSKQENIETQQLYKQNQTKKINNLDQSNHDSKKVNGFFINSSFIEYSDDVNVWKKQMEDKTLENIIEMANRTADVQPLQSRFFLEQAITICKKTEDCGFDSDSSLNYLYELSELYLMLGKNYLKTGQENEAMLCFRASVNSSARPPGEAYDLLTDLYLKRGQKDAVVKLLEEDGLEFISGTRWLNASKQYDNLCLKLATIYYERGHNEKTIKFLDLGKRYADDEETMKKIQSIQDKFVATNYLENQAIFFYDQGQLSKCLDTIERAINIFPSSNYFFIKALAAYKLGKYKIAFDAIQKVWEGYPERDKMYKQIKERLEQK